MKTRTGFVSNSSSSSFIVYGYSAMNDNAVYNFIQKVAPELLTDEQNDQYETGDVDMGYVEEIFEHHALNDVFDVLVTDDETMFGVVQTHIEEEYESNYMDQARMKKVAAAMEDAGLAPEIIFGTYAC